MHVLPWTGEAKGGSGVCWGDEPGIFCNESRPLASFYLPERRNQDEWGTRVEIVPVSRMEGLMTLIGQSFVPNTVEALGLQANRMGFFARMISRVPVRRVVYPDGLQYLPRVWAAILDDLADLPSEPEGV